MSAEQEINSTNNSILEPVPVLAQQQPQPQKKPKGGARPGAGRKPKAEKHGTAIEQAENRICDRLPEIVDSEIALAIGGEEIIEEKWLPAGMLTIEYGDGHILAFPHLQPTDMVLVERKVSRTPRNRQANEYLINRILGAVPQKVQQSLTFTKMSDDELIAFITDQEPTAADNDFDSSDTGNQSGEVGSDSGS